MIKNSRGNRLNAVAADGAVDWDHPINRYLSDWWIAPPGTPQAGSRFLNLANSKRHGVITGATTAANVWRAHQNGFAKFDNTTVGGIIVASAPILVNEFCVTINLIVPTMTGDQAMFRLDDGADANAVWWYLQSGQNQKVDPFDSGGSPNTVTGGVSITAGIVHTLQFQITGGNSFLYVDGVLDASGSTAARSTANQPFSLGLGANNDVSQPLKSGIIQVLVHIGPVDAKAIYAAYQLPALMTPDSPLRWASTRTYSVPAGGAGSFTSSLSSTITLSAAFTKADAKAIAASITPSAVIRKGDAKPLAGSLTPSATMAKGTGKALAGTATLGGAISRAIAKALAGTATLTGVCAKGIGRPLTGAITTAGNLAKGTGKALAGALTTSGAIAKGVGKSLADSLTPSALMSKGTGKSLAGTLTPSGAISKAIGKVLAGVVSLAGSFSAGGQLFISFASSITLSGAMRKAIDRPMAGTASLAGVMRKGVGKALASSLTLAGSMAKAVGKLLASTVTLAGSFTSSIGGAASGALLLLRRRWNSKR